MADVATCSAPGCSEPGTNKCSSCKITLYCCVACQTIDWPSHKEECQGHLLKLGKKHLEKANGFEREHNFVQSLRSSELALIQLKKLHPSQLEVMDNAMTLKYNALNFLNRKKESLECAQERYSLWVAGYMRHAGMLNAAFGLIESLLHNKEFDQAHLIAHTANEMIINDTDNIIPEDRRQRFLANGSQYLARAIFFLAKSGGIAPEAKKKAGEEAIALARKALEIDTRVYGAESMEVATDMGTLADVLDCFNSDTDYDEAFRLYEQVIHICSRLQGSSSPNVAVGNNNLGNAYLSRAYMDRRANDLDRCVANLELALIHFREANRIHRAINHMDSADDSAQNVSIVEEQLQLIQIAARETTTA